MSDYVTSFIPGGDYLNVTHYIPGGDYLSPSHYLPGGDYLGSSPSVPSSPSIPSSPNAPIDTTGSPWGNAQTPTGVTPDPNLPSPVDLTSSTGTLPSIPGSSGIPNIPGISNILPGETGGMPNSTGTGLGTLGNTIANTIIGTGTKAAIGAGLGALGIGSTTGTTGTTGTTNMGSTNMGSTNTGSGANNTPTMVDLTPGLTKGNTSDYSLGGVFGGAIPMSNTSNMPKFKEGGHIPEFYSEGGAKHSNTYVTGEGDGTSDSVPAMLATGEFVLPADIVSSLGNGNNDSGSKVLDSFLKVIREHKQDHDPKDLPPDSKGPLGYLSIAVKKVGK